MALDFPLLEPGLESDLALLLGFFSGLESESLDFESLESLLFELESSSPESDLALELEYASAYQPLPYKTNDVRENSFFTRRERQEGQVFTGSSVMRCSRSNSWSHFSQAYS